ncbi:MAG: cation:proton antiporter [Alphaproteobacteria bacterium]
MSVLELAAILLSIASFFGYINYRFIKLPHTVGLVIISLFVSFAAIALHFLNPNLHIDTQIEAILKNIDFNKFLMEGILSMLLFAGALHVSLDELLKNKWTVGTLASVGVIISTFIMGTCFYYLAALFGIDIPYMVALVFGALISPTDPVAVLALFKKIKLSPRLQVTITGESLFNDGVGVVVYTILVGVAFAATAGGHAQTDFSVLSAIMLFIKEAFGGALLGLIMGYIVFLFMRSIDEYILEIMMSLALVTATYTIALQLHVSGPIAMVVAGLLTGNAGTRLAMSDQTREHLEDFWELMDEILNSILFILIGFEILIINETKALFALSLVMIPVSLMARWVSVAMPLTLMRQVAHYSRGTIRILTVAGLKGGISVALALALPESPYKGAILSVTYAIVIFSILGQGLTVEKVIRRFH